MGYFNEESSVYNSTSAAAYRVLVGGLLNSDKSASIINIETITNPNSQTMAGFIEDVRSLCTSHSSKAIVNGGKVEMYLVGGYTTTLDVQNSLLKLVPVMIAVTCIVVLFFISINFGSAMLSIRLVFTVVVSLAWTYGLLVS
jgi:predicted RND superfamily exporter protein